VKPDWKDAPAWAEYMAQDGNGIWNWFSHKPKWIEGCEYWSAGPGTRIQYIDLCSSSAVNSLEAKLAPDVAAFIDIVFDGPPGPEAPRFVDVEDGTGCSINAGKWEQGSDGYWVLRITPDNFK